MFLCRRFPLLRSKSPADIGQKATFCVSLFGLTDFAADSVLLFVCLGFSIAADIIFLHLVDDLIKKKRLEDQQELQKRHHASLLEQERAMRELRHDIANHIITSLCNKVFAAY